MQTSRIGLSLGLFAAVALGGLTACKGDGKGSGDGKTDAKTAVDAKTPPVAAGGDAAVGSGGGSGDAAGSGGEASTGGAAGSGGEASTGGAAGSGEGSGGTDAGAEGSGGTGGEEGSGDDAASTGGGPDTAALLKELKKKRTKDARATEIVAQLEEAGVESIDVAKALTARGRALFDAPERAKALYELALEKDPKYPDPAFELAKQAAIMGELDEAKKWLKVVKERKGTKLLKQIDFDPMWEILKDDPEVRALLK